MPSGRGLLRKKEKKLEHEKFEPERKLEPKRFFRPKRRELEPVKRPGVRNRLREWSAARHERRLEQYENRELPLQKISDGMSSFGERLKYGSLKNPTKEGIAERKQNLRQADLFRLTFDKEPVYDKTLRQRLSQRIKNLPESLSLKNISEYAKDGRLQESLGDIAVHTSPSSELVRDLADPLTRVGRKKRKERLEEMENYSYDKVRTILERYKEDIRDSEKVLTEVIDLFPVTEKGKENLLKYRQNIVAQYSPEGVEHLTEKQKESLYREGIVDILGNLEYTRSLRAIQIEHGFELGVKTGLYALTAFKIIPAAHSSLSKLLATTPIAIGAHSLGDFTEFTAAPNVKIKVHDHMVDINPELKKKLPRPSSN